MDDKIFYYRVAEKADLDGNVYRKIQVVKPSEELPKVLDDSVEIMGTLLVTYWLDQDFEVTFQSNPKYGDQYIDMARWMAKQWQWETEALALDEKLRKQSAIVDPDTTVDMEFEYIDYPKRLAVATTQDLTRLLDEWDEIEELISRITDGPGQFANFYGDHVLLDSMLGMCNDSMEEFEKAEAVEKRLAALDWSGFTLTSIGMIWPYRAWEGIYDHWLLIQLKPMRGGDAPLPKMLFEVDIDNPDLPAAIAFLQERVDVHENS
jgi:hypothetical protein